MAETAKSTGLGEGGNAGLSLSTAHVRGVEIPWAAEGLGNRGFPVVLLAGLGWRATGCVAAGWLGRDLPVIGMDYPRRWPRRPLDSMAEVAELYAAAIEALVRPPVCLAGVSMGGMLALEIALRRPALVESLALVSTASAGGRVGGRWRVPASRAAAALVPEASFYHLYRRWGPAVVGASAFASPAEAARLWSDPMSRRKMADLLQAVAGFDAGSRLAELATPALVVHGARDRLFPPEAALALAARLPRSRLVVVDGAGHFAFLTHRARVLAELRRFWSARGTTASGEEGDTDEGRAQP